MLKHHQVFLRLFAVLAAVLAFNASALAAQTNATQTYTLKPVVVQARKRAEQAQDIPGAMTVIDEMGIENMNIREVEDLALHVPGLEFKNFGSRRHGLTSLRGVQSIPNGIPGTGFVVDGVTYSKSWMFNIPLIDIEQIEVLKGAQGTLYGRNTIGGVINIRTKQPDNGKRSEVEVDYGSFNAKQARGNWSGPLVEDRIYASFAGLYMLEDGFEENDIDAAGDEGRHRDGKVGRGTLRFTPTDDWDIVLTLDGQRHEEGAYPFRRTQRNAFVKAGTYGEDERHHYSHNFEGTSEYDNMGVTLNADYEAGAGTFTSITGMRNSDFQEQMDADMTPRDQMVKDLSQKDRDFSQEFRFASPEGEGPLKWVVGTYLFNMVTDKSDTNYYGAAAGARAGTQMVFDTEIERTGGAVFGQGTYSFLKDFELTLGMRAEVERASVDASRYDSLTATQKIVEDSETYTPLLPKFSLAWHVTGEHTVYGTVARAHRSGGFNTVGTAPAGRESYDEESSWQYELGMKSFFLEKRLMANIAGFYTQIDDEQLTQFDATTMQPYYDNAGRSHRLGLEVEAAYKLTRDLELSANACWIDARYDSYSDPVTNTDYKGNRVFNTPGYTYAVAADYRHLFRNEWSLFGHVDYSVVGEQYFNDANTVKEEEYGLVNLRLGVQKGALETALWVKNAFDEEYVLFENTSAGVAEDGAPRTFGVSVKYRF